MSKGTACLRAGTRKIRTQEGARCDDERDGGENKLKVHHYGHWKVGGNAGGWQQGLGELIFH